MTRNPRPKFLSLPEAADDFGICTKTIRRRISDGTLPAYRVGGRLRIKETDLERLAQRVPAAGAR